MTNADFDKPIIAIANSFTQFVPGQLTAPWILDVDATVKPLYGHHLKITPMHGKGEQASAQC